MNVALRVLAFAALISMAHGMCANNCNGHGVCGEHDSCACHRNWQGNDCSERVCPYAWSFITTPQGDLNMDGDIYDAMQYLSAGIDTSDTISATLANKNLLTQANPAGTWEIWPSYAAVNADEGHFYMECSNRGLCDRKSGICQCFDGYEGVACSRTVCPEDCSGHGTCESAAETAAASNFVYNLWDADKSFACTCDPGWKGVDCSMRQCPHGDDPLVTTTTGLGTAQQTAARQKNEIVYIDVDVTHGGASSSTLGGYIVLSWTDEFGETWSTQSVNVAAHTTSATATATNLLNALLAVPNAVFTEITVEQEFIEYRLPAKYTSSAADFTATAYSNTESSWATTVFADCALNTATYCDDTNDGTEDLQQEYSVSVDGAAGLALDATVEFVRSGNGGASDTFSTATTPGTAAADSRVSLRSDTGIRLKVNFEGTLAGGNPGDIADFRCHTNGLTGNAPTCKPKTDIVHVFEGYVDQGASDNTVVFSAYVEDILNVDDRIYLDTDGPYYIKSLSGNTATIYAAQSGDVATGIVSVNFDGSTERHECSRRGLCDHETGTCACFRGYHHDDCSEQNVMAT